MSHADSLWICTIHDLWQRRAPAQAPGTGVTHVVGELRFDTPTTPAEVVRLASSCAWCFESYRVQLVQLFLSYERKRALLLFRAPDAEAVRLAFRKLQMAFKQAHPGDQIRGPETP